MKKIFDLLDLEHELIFRTEPPNNCVVTLINNRTLKQKTQWYPSNDSHTYNDERLISLIKWLITETN